ncbi:MAG: TATA-box-binding protein [Candidatus Hodarchaeales archaeon]|jgi:transcription initiation factor TFIID TATA-box-binding protein
MLASTKKNGPETAPDKKITIQNVVATVDLGGEINIEQAASRLSPKAHVSYIPEQFPGIVVKIQEPKVTFLVFRTGKMVATGAKSREMIVEAVNIVAGFLREAEATAKSSKTPQITVRNVVASGGLGYRINLELAALLMDNAMYEPEQFPGLIYRMHDPKAVLLLFQSGSLVCTGARKETDVNAAVDKVSEILQEIDALEEGQ